jgi:NDP-hexose-3-ketoreductase
MRKLNVAVWGLGPHALKNILPALESCEGIQITGVCSRKEDVVSRTLDRLQCSGWTNPESMLADAKVEVVYVSTPTGLHARHGQLVLNANKHLWCEKPICETAAQAEALVRLSRDRGVTIAEAFMYLYHKQFSYLGGVLAAGRLGHVHSVTCRFGIPPLENPGFRTDPELGGGAFLDVGSYPISALVSLFPNRDPVVSFSEVIVAEGSSVDTAGRALLRYDADLTATLEWRTVAAYRNEIDLWGTDGSVSTERLFSKPPDYIPKFRFLDVNGRETLELGEPGNHFQAMFRAFIDLIDDPVRAENERALIVRRARLAQRIRNHPKQ